MSTLDNRESVETVYLVREPQMDRQDRPGADRRNLNAGIPPHSVPQQMPDRKETPETLLTDNHGRALLVRQPRCMGFRPPR